MLHLLALPVVVSALASEAERLPISRGDNLSSISKTVFGDGNYWPKIWSTNNNQSSEKMVNPGNSIQFLLGDEEAPPAFAISESYDDGFLVKAPPPALAMRPVAAVKAASNGDFEMPAPKVRPKPILQLGHIFPSWQGVAPRRSDFKDYSVEVVPRRVNPVVDREFIPVYVQDSAVRPIGEYVQTAGDSGLTIDGEEVLLRMKSGAGQVGAHYLLLHDAGKMQEGWGVENGHHDGHVIEVLAEVVLISNEPSEHDGSWDHFRGKVTHAVSASYHGAVVVPGEVTWLNTSPNGTVSNLQAEIIGGNFDSRGMVFGQGDWVFLNRGAKDGLTEGQLVWINSFPGNYEPDSPFSIGVHNSALVKVAKVASEISTAFVISSKQSLMQHDFSGGPSASATRDRSEPADSGDDLSNEIPSSDDPGIGIDTGTDSMDSNELKDIDSGSYDKL